MNDLLHTITQQELARRASSDPSTTRAMLVLLEGRGLVARRRNPQDSRARLVTLSARGWKVFRRLWETSEPIRAQMAAGFSAEEVRALVDDLRRLMDNLASARGPGRKRARRVPTGTAPSGN